MRFTSNHRHRQGSAAGIAGQFIYLYIETRDYIFRENVRFHTLHTHWHEIVKPPPSPDQINPRIFKFYIYQGK
ncbi:hypothetical protein Hanom_Chr06g00546751 [Helianthus anomalus]